jgi:hypothetical protein
MKTEQSFSARHRAKTKMEKLKAFYMHLAIYIVINSVITGVNVSNSLGSWEAFISELLTFNVFSTWLVWGIVLAIHAFSVFLFPVILGYDWEERKIEQLMQEELNSKK